MPRGFTPHTRATPRVLTEETLMPCQHVSLAGRSRGPVCRVRVGTTPLGLPIYHEGDAVYGSPDLPAWASMSRATHHPFV